MRKHLNKITFLFVIFVFLFLLTSCEPLNALINNLTGNNTTEIENKDYIEVNFDYNLEGYEGFSLMIKKGEKLYEPLKPVATGYLFVGWQTKDNKLYNFGLNVYENTTIIASWQLDDNRPNDDEYFKITYNYNIPQTDLTTIKVFKSKKAIEPVVPARLGYVFDGWYLNNNLYDFNTPILSDINLHAKWSIEDVTNYPLINITFNFDNGLDNIKIKVKHGTKIMEPKNPTKEGYSFVGWFKDNDDINPFNFQTHITTDLILTPKWELGETNPVKPSFEGVNVIFNYNVPNVSNDSITINKGSKTLEPKIMEKEGFIFKGWFKNLEDDEPYDFTENINEDLSLIAKWENIVYTKIIVDVTFVYVDENNEVITFTVEAEKDFPMEKPEAPNKKYYDFTGWYLEDSDTPFDFAKTIDKSYILVAKWKLKDDKVRVSFMKNEDDLLKSYLVPLNSIIVPLDLEEDINNTFIGWKDKEDNFFDFNKPIFEHTILYAVYYPNFEGVNNISKNIIRGNVKIYKTLYEDNSDKAISKSTGSGVIVKNIGNDYYVLTNSHVITTIYKTEEDTITYASKVDYEIEDYLGKIYEATLVIDGETTEVGHDLAILKFTVNPSDVNDLNVISISNTFDKTHLLAIIGQPHGQKNTITFGNFDNQDNRSIKQIDGSFKTYDAIKINVPGAKGSSGSMVINQDHEIVGIVFAGASDIDFINSTYMIAVPLEYINKIMVELEDILIIDTLLTSSMYYSKNFIRA